MYEEDKIFSSFLEMEGIQFKINPSDKKLSDMDALIKNFPDLVDAYSRAISGQEKHPDTVMYWNGTIRNNDIEMVIEAFYTGKRQNFQKQGLFGDEVSTVLGKGN